MKEVLENIFITIDKFTKSDECDSFENLLKSKITTNKNSENISRHSQWLYVEELMCKLNKLSNILKEDSSILISVKNQKILRHCFQLITSLGVLPALIPGVGINLNKRSEKASLLPPMKIDDTDKYKLLKQCTDFFVDSYSVPVLKNIIITSHLADYLAALIQLAFAPLKKPGVYKDFTMTQQMYDLLQSDKNKYTTIYNKLVSTCFQPIIIKELIILQSGKDPPPPKFFSNVVSKELSNRLLAPGGLVSLMRCFIESQNIDVGHDWKKVDMIRRIVGIKHGTQSADTYLKNICKQLKEVISSTNVHFYSTATACILYLREKFPHNEELEALSDEVLNCFNLQSLESKNCPSGSIVLTSQEIDRNIDILHSLFCVLRLNESIGHLSKNINVLTLIRLKCTKSEERQKKIDSLVMKYFEEINENDLSIVMKQILFGDGLNIKFTIEEHDSGIILKSSSNQSDHPIQEASQYCLRQLKGAKDHKVASKIFEISLEKLLNLAKERTGKEDHSLMEIEDDPLLVDNLDTRYATVLQLLEELCGMTAVISSVIKEPEYVFKFIENILLDVKLMNSDESVSIALVLLNILLTECCNMDTMKIRCVSIIPILHNLKSGHSMNGMLAEEILTIINSGERDPPKTKTVLEKTVSNIFDDLLPVKAHGLIELTKLIEMKDPETIAKKHYVLCLFQEQLKHEDSYVYLAAINGIATLGQYCTEDVLNVLCKEYLETSVCSSEVETSDLWEKRARLRMKVGDVVVKVTRNLGEMAAVHKTLLLNTVLCACKDDDFLLRASALSNLAEIALVFNYRLGSILYEVLQCICSILQSDSSPECRRAAVMVISSLLKGLGKNTLIQLEDSLLPIYRTLKQLYNNEQEDSAVRLHAQIALEELNDIVRDFIRKIEVERKITLDINKIDVKFK